MPDVTNPNPQDTQGQQGQSGAAQQGEGERVFATYDELYENLPEAHRKLIDASTKGLKSALDKERSDAAALDKKLKAIEKKLEEGSDARSQIEAMRKDLASARKQTSFFTAAHAAKVSNLDLAFIAAEKAGLIEDDGSVDMDQLKAKFPELFAQQTQPAPAGNAGSGQNNQQPRMTMNQLIRAAAGYQS